MIVFQNNSVFQSGSKMNIFNSVYENSINFYTYNYSCDVIVSIGNTFWNNVEEVPIFNKTLNVLVCNLTRI